MLIEAAIKGLVTPGKTLNKLKTNPAVISTLTDYIAEVEKLLQLPVVIAEVTAADIAKSHQLGQAHALFVNDSINLACAHRLSIANIVTNDRDFNRVATVSVWEPADV
jgi:predicted nucleic acid-binding protein